MITTTLMLLLVCQQEPNPTPGAGFAEASRIYQQVASGPISGTATLQSRVETVQRRVEELQAQITKVSSSLVSLERQEMETSLAIQSAFQDAERDRRLAELQQTIAPKRAVLEENRTILERDLDGARQDLGQLQLELDLARAVTANAKGNNTTATARVEDKVRRYFREKARALGLPKLQPLPRYWLSCEDRLE
jgi:chromosome segregation ATPase